MALGASATIVIVIVCCGAFVCCLGAVGWVYRRQGYDEERGVEHGWRPSNPQADYMREVRQTNHNGMMHISGYQKPMASHSTTSLDQPSAVTYPSRSMSRSEVLSYDARSPYQDNVRSYAEESPYSKQTRDKVRSYGEDSYYTENEYEQYEQQYYDYPSPLPRAAY